MPSHQDRVSGNYKNLCSRCLKNPDRFWDNDSTEYWLCTDCYWIKQFKENPRDRVPPHMVQYINLNEYELDTITSPLYPMYIRKETNKSETPSQRNQEE